MIIGRIIGNVVATRKDPRLEGKKLLLVRPITLTGEDESSYLVAVDTVGALPGHCHSQLRHAGELLRHRDVSTEDRAIPARTRRANYTRTGGQPPLPSLRPTLRPP